MSKQLDGLNVLLTRAAHQVEAPAARLRELGANVICLPLIEIAPPESWDDLDKAITHIADYDWIIFVSANAVDAFFNRVKGTTTKFPRFATIGPKTTERLRAHGQDAAFQAEAFVAESFIQDFPAKPGERILWPKASVGRMLIADELRKRAVNVEAVHVYQTKLPQEAFTVATELELLIIEKSIDVIMLASSQTVHNLRKLLDLVKVPTSALEHVTILAIGPITARTAIEQLGRCDIQASEYTAEGMIDSLAAHNTQMENRNEKDHQRRS